MTAPSSEDLEMAREDALLQLRIGRSSHYYAVLISGALAVDGLLVLFFPPALAGNSWSWPNLYFYLPIVASGLFLAIFALRVKWEEYQLWPWELHFSTTVGAVLVNLVATGLFLAGVLDVGPTASWPLVPWLLPLALGGTAMAMAGLSLTWTSRSERQLASLVTALIPVPLGFVLFLPNLDHAALVNALAIALLFCAFAFQTSGSFLHLISSGTRAHERELITSGQTRMFVLADELRQREESVRLREAAVLEREVTLDHGELSVKRRLEAHEEARRHLERLEGDYRQRAEALSGAQSDWAARQASTESQRKEVEDQEADLHRRETELTARMPGLAERERTVAAQEGEVARREVDLARLQDEATRRLEIVRENEARLEARRLDLERRTAELFREESHQRTTHALSNATEEDRARLAGRLADLEGRETRMNQLQVQLDDLNASVALQTEELSKSSKSLTEREERHARAEAALAQRAAVVDQRETEAASAQRVADARKDEYAKALSALTEREKDTIGLRAELDRRLADLQRRELDLTERDQRGTERDRVATERERALDRREIEKRSTAPAPVAGVAPAPSTPATPEAVPVVTPAAAGGNAGRRRLGDRTSIGAPRLDDLLLGGLPPRAHVLLEGPPFSGKEVLLYQFLAEGLRRGQTAIMVAGGRPAAEIAQAMSHVLPEFPDRQARGQVLWIDTSESPPPSSPRKVPAGQLASAGSDPATVLSSLVQAAKRAESAHPDGFRVGALGFAHLFAGVEPAKGAAFFQNFVGILKERNALAVYAVDEGVLPEPLVSALQSRADGVIEFREDRGKSQLAVRGLGDVETRDWVEYRSSPAGITLGSFALERIR